MAKKNFVKDAEGLTPIKVTEIVPIGITRFIPGRTYRVNDDILEQIGNKAEPAND